MFTHGKSYLGQDLPYAVTYILGVMAKWAGKNEDS